MQPACDVRRLAHQQPDVEMQIGDRQDVAFEHLSIRCERDKSAMNVVLNKAPEAGEVRSLCTRRSRDRRPQDHLETSLSIATHLPTLEPSNVAGLPIYNSEARFPVFVRSCTPQCDDH